MSTPDLIQQQRKLLRKFRQIYTEYVVSKNTATEQFKKEQEAATGAFNQARQKPDEQVGKAHDALNEARSILIKGNWLSDTKDRWPKPEQQTDNPVDELSRYATEAVEILKKLQSQFVRNGTVLRARSHSETVIASAVASLLGGVIVGVVGVGVMETAIVFLPMFVIVAGGFFFPVYSILNDSGKTPNVYTALLRSVSNSAFAHQCLIEQLQATYQHQLIKSQTYYDQKISSLTQLFQSKLEQIHQAFITFNSHAHPISPIWVESVWNTWTPNETGPFISRFGELKLSSQNLPLLPALLHLPGEHSVVFKVGSSAKSRVVNAIQSVLARLLATIPPGKLRFTFIDPIGLGQNVAGFMHLAEYNEQLVTSKAWTEPQHIEQQLANLTEHMENVIQKYLRNQFATIEAYNAQAGEVAEPYRMLAVFDFPANFSETAARRLISIAQNGPRCGVYAVVLVDMEKPLPHGFKLADLEQNATVIAWDGKRFVWQDEDFKDCLLELDEPPPAELFNHIIKTVGKAARLADKVEVSFERMFALFEEQRREDPVAYPGLPHPTLPGDPTTWWRGNTSNDLIAQLGRAGAKQIQCLDLGKGTNHNALLAGRVGSGKSTLLHTLIASLVLNYSPAEVELYLIDFKEVEFKTYATHALPHARVVAIQSEREFSLSVLQRLDGELQHRKELFNAIGADTNRLDKYRAKSGRSLPRILLVVDEFQEFFAEDDAIASLSGQLLDRLARQGRAFGIHVLLGSQTLAGAYGLARSTMGQMAVRVSLQCSEADSRLILADDNPAARLLSRPGEAIYNANDGMVGHNNIFQVAWLTDQERDHYLNQVTALAQQRGYRATPRIFDGNAPANIEQLTERLVKPEQIDSKPSKMVAWLGDPIAIRDQPLTVPFRKQSGSNLLIVGQSEEAALSMLAAALLSFAAQTSSPELSEGFYVLDFGTADDSHADYFVHLAEHLPHPLQLGRRRQLADFLHEIALEVQYRIAAADTPSPNLGEGRGGGSIFLLIHGLHRARDLRPDDSAGFGYSLSSEPQPPTLPQQFASILRDGPEVGVHTLAWCDTMTNLERTLDRRTLREFALRVAMQMSEQDSSLLLDTPAANRLGLHRALFYSEDEGRLEKFRPYGLPAVEWLQAVSTQWNKHRT